MQRKKLAVQTVKGTGLRHRREGSENHKNPFAELYQNLPSHGGFPGNAVVETTTAGGVGSIPGQGTKILHAMRCGQMFFFNILKRTFSLAVSTIATS